LRKQFDVPLHLEQGSPFQQKVWRALADIPFGVTRTYEDIACTISQENTIEARKMARAVGSACGANPLPLILPCHRVIGKNGRLVGFSGGLDIKEYLLAHEIMGLA
jgi:O-6-methylguanine DNA methyltransferase